MESSGGIAHGNAFDCVSYRRGRTVTTTDRPTLEVVRRGRVVRLFGAHEITLGPGCASMHPPGLVITSAQSSGAEGYRFFLPREVPVAAFDFTARAWSLSLLNELETRDEAWETIVEGLVLQGWGWLTRRHALEHDRPAWLDDAIALARDQRPLSAIAAALGRHASHVARAFRRHEGVSVGEFSRRCRLELAARALSGNARPIGEIALAAGFCDQSHFTNAFRRVFGVTPAAFRQRTSSRS